MALDFNVFDPPLAPPTDSLIRFPSGDSAYGLPTEVWVNGAEFTYDATTGLLNGGTISSIELVVIIPAVGPYVIQTYGISGGYDAAALFTNVLEPAGAVNAEVNTWGSEDNTRPFTYTATEIRIPVSGGKTVLVTGTGFQLDPYPLAGTVTSIQLIGADGTTVEDSVPGVNGLSLDLLALAFGNGEILGRYVLTGNDVIVASSLPGIPFNNGHVPSLDGGQGNDVIIGSINGGSGVDYSDATAAVTVNLAAGRATGGGGNDILQRIVGASGSAYDDQMFGNAGDNWLSGEAGNDTISGGGGNDWIYGGLGNDSLNGGLGTGDTLNYMQGYYEDEDVTAGVTVSLAITTAQNTGGGGTDIISGFENLRGTQFGDNLSGTGGANQLVGAGGNDTINGAFGNDRIFGDIDDYYFNGPVQFNNGADSLLGGNGHDTIYGGDGNDTINGGADNDWIYGGNGNDMVWGGAGQDRFVFNTAPHSWQSFDTIRDFSVADDTIVLDSYTFGFGGSTGALADLEPGAFRVGTRAMDADDRIIYNPTNGYLYYDADGNGAGTAVRFALLSTGLALTIADFEVGYHTGYNTV